MLKNNPISLIAAETPFLNRLMMLVIALACLFAVVVVIAVIAYGAKSLPSPIVPAAGVLSVSSYEAREGRANDTALLERPVFWQERTPYAPPEENAEVAVAPKENASIDEMQLIGVFAAGSESSVTLRYKKETHHLRIDDELAGWTLLTVAGQGAIFGRTDTLDGELVSTQIELDHGPSLPTQWQGGHPFEGERN